MASRQPAKLAIAGFEQAHDVRLDGYVGLDGRRAAAGAGDLGDDRSGRGRVRLVVHTHGVAARRGKPGGRGANAAARTGDQDDAHGTVIFSSAP